jgi:hypothetical protein
VQASAFLPVRGLNRDTEQDAGNAADDEASGWGNEGSTSHNSGNAG